MAFTAAEKQLIVSSIQEEIAEQRLNNDAVIQKLLNMVFLTPTDQKTEVIRLLNALKTKTQNVVDVFDTEKATQLTGLNTRVSELAALVAKVKDL